MGRLVTGGPACLSGASFNTTARPAVGERVFLGKTTAAVVRHTEFSFAMIAHKGEPASSGRWADQGRMSTFDPKRTFSSSPSLGGFCNCVAGRLRARRGSRLRP
jgi:hypothetical protein